MVYAKAGLDNFIFILVLWVWGSKTTKQLNETENANMSFSESNDFV